ncbi:unnamed protein product [[Candida] boidinii]|uniref:Unnamed protein product n=1 Tax=Candida boidinii TaxID=5477 RepID=A0A9W6WJI4_CANBO|nr:unnamed protein product [[Candida] boidinii]GMF04053.1 unnamed protein product [[Candida] boidinii]GMF50251.1 unnamed protein product [[Candida] boidinii]GMG04410.1 unnamed protein product [[Candida] boidinii]
MSEEDIYDVDKEARMMMNVLGDDPDNHISTLGNNPNNIINTNSNNHISTLGNNEGVPPPPVNSLSYLDKVLFTLKDFEENDSGLKLFLAVLWLLLCIAFATFALVVGFFEWSHNKANSLVSFYWVFVASFHLFNVGPYCYKHRARIWNLFRFKRDDNNHRYTTAADNNRALETEIYDRDCTL